MLIVVYSLTIFLSATLLFVVQPMFARMALPLLGGAPAVWNTALVFYQAALLVGYLYAHLTTKWLGVRKQVMVHMAVILLPLLALPIAVPLGWTPPTNTNPIPWLLALLLIAVGLPFWVVSTSSPLLQKWFAASGHRSAADPYFLYAASNLGSMLSLLSYPVLIEPNLRLVDQSYLWSLGYGLLILMTASCAFLVLRAPQTPTAEHTATSPVQADTERLTNRRRLRWIWLSFIPSSLMVSVTTYLSTDIAAIPLLWIIPLALYLLTFILVFAQRRIFPHWLMVRALPFAVLPLVIALAAQANQPIGALIMLHLVAFFTVTMVCHGELANDRPSTRYLTEFYLWMSVGGVLGGIFNALIAPLAFSAVVEYPLTLVFACLVGSQVNATTHNRRVRILDWVLPLGVALLTVAIIQFVQSRALGSSPLTTALIFGVPAFICFSFSRRSLRFGLGVGAFLLGSTFYVTEEGHTLHTERSFFGINRVTSSKDGQYHILVHGSTLHGLQSVDIARQREPLSYYYPGSPIGQVFNAFNSTTAKQSVAVVGLGAGSLACYGKPGQQWTFFEIDPSVERIARDSRYFTFLRDCPADVVLGDARLSLASVPDHQYDLLILDAYSSDAIPLHLLSREALKLYTDKLAPDGLLAFNISNRHLDIEPVLGNLARDAGLICLVQTDDLQDETELQRGSLPSQWAVMARRTEDLGALANDPRWQPAREQPDASVWTDDFASLISVFR